MQYCLMILHKKENQVPTSKTIKSITTNRYAFSIQLQNFATVWLFVCPTAKTLSDQIHLILHRVKEERSWSLEDTKLL